MRLSTKLFQDILQKIADSKLPYIELCDLLQVPDVEEYQRLYKTASDYFMGYKSIDAKYNENTQTIYALTLLYESSYIYLQSNIDMQLAGNGMPWVTQKPLMRMVQVEDVIKELASTGTSNDHLDRVFVNKKARIYLTYFGYQLLDALENNTWTYSVKKVLGDIGTETIKKLPFSLISSIIKTSLS